jgi:hypothetical protein
MAAVGARHELSDLTLGSAVAPAIHLILVGVGLFLGKPPFERLPLGRFGSGRAELEGSPISVACVPGVVAISVERCILGAVTLEELAGVIASGHVVTSELAASPRAWQAVYGRLLLRLAPSH